jgi:hypothetical protein
MATHRQERPGHRASPPQGRRRADKARPRYGRLAVLGASLSVTGIAMLGGVGVLPSVASGDSGQDRVRHAGAETGRSVVASAESSAPPSAEPDPESASKQSSKSTSPEGSATTQVTEPPTDPPPPEDSGEGRRIVFDQSDQRVWLIEEDGTVERTYLVSGSLYDNLDPGTYAVYSRSEQAWGVDDSGTMQYFVRFTEGDNGAAIGFHDIPVDDGAPVQTVEQLGTPQSHGCIRQAREDAIALWEFAPIGTEVDVTA